jgi:hypothetical protein
VQIDVQIGMQLEAKSEIPESEFSHFTAGIAAAIQPRAFSPKEVIVMKDSAADGMYLVNKGIVVSEGKLFTKGDFCCVEGIVFKSVVYRGFFSVTYAIVDLVTKTAVDELLDTRQFPAIHCWLRRFRRRMSFLRVMRMATQYREMLAGGATGTVGAQAISAVLPDLERLVQASPGVLPRKLPDLQQIVHETSDVAQFNQLLPVLNDSAGSTAAEPLSAGGQAKTCGITVVQWRGPTGYSTHALQI